ncbi:LysO family transporter [Limisalsivibrio acetivorans]|uniref:LysO family transporter n=1 Tax=Limisalsivibrio acetivorans TaxID=1304888 RepID=UPI0003B3ECF4|nr:LysO family transporter [Limisalsivibrio acetivorans]
MLYYALAVLAGLVPALLLPQGWFLNVRKHLFTASLVALLFLMGVGLGSDPQIIGKLGKFGIVSFVIALSSIVFSVIAVLIMVRLFGGKQK